MTMQDPIADMLTRIRNAQRVSQKRVSMPASTVKTAIAEVLKQEGYILDYDIDKENDKKPLLEILLKYFEGAPVIKMIKRISRSGMRIYKRHHELPRVMGGLGIAIISTSKGIISDRAARRLKVGGEILCYVE